MSASGRGSSPIAATCSALLVAAGPVSRCAAPSCPPSSSTRSATAAMSSSWMGAESPSAKTPRTVSPARICGAYWSALVAKALGRRKVQGQPAVADLPLGGGVHDVDGVGLVGALLDDAAGEQDDVPYAVLAGGGQQRGRAGLRVQEELRRSGEQGRGVVRPEGHHLGPLRQRGPPRVAGQRPDGRSRGEETVDEGTADVAGRAGHYDHGAAFRGLGRSLTARA